MPASTRILAGETDLEPQFIDSIGGLSIDERFTQPIISESRGAAKPLLNDDQVETPDGTVDDNK